MKIYLAVLWPLFFSLSFLLHSHALGQDNRDPECTSRSEVQDLIAERKMNPNQVRKYLESERGCTFEDDTNPVPASPRLLAGPIKILPGLTFYEEIDSCGYHPQRKELACDIAVKQNFGFAGTPPGSAGLMGPGSFEWIAFCVDFGNGVFRPVHVSSVHVHDNPTPALAAPNWYYSIVVQNNPAMQIQPQDGRTLQAKAILSWTIIPNSCNFVPLWGHSAFFQIKLDP